MSEAHHNSEDEEFSRISDQTMDPDDSSHKSHESSNSNTDSVAGSGSSAKVISEYCQVVFQNVAESYKPGRHLECYYILSPVLTPTPRDYVGVFKVGWNSPRKYHTFEYAPYPKNWKPNEEFKQCLIFNNYYLPSEETGEFYQFCYIDSMGKMRGASTPFQFLETPMEDFMEIADESLDILMIQSRKSHNSELIEKLTTDRDSLALEKAQIEKEKNQLVGKVEEVESSVTVKEEEILSLNAKIESLNVTVREIPDLQDKLASTDLKLDEVTEEKKHCEQSLQQATDAMLEIQDKLSGSEKESNILKRQMEHVTRERNEFKSQFASSEKNNEILRIEVDNLKQELMVVVEKQHIICAQEDALKEQKQMVEKQLLVASADQEYKIVLQAQVVELENSLTKTEKAYACSKEHLSAMSDVHIKLTKDFENAKVECDHLKTKLTRQGDDFRQKQMKMEKHMAISRHEAKERKDLLEEQVQALKEGIQKLAKEKENLMQGTMGSEEASNVVVQTFKDRMKRAQRMSEQECQRKLQLQKELVDLKEQHKDDKDDLKQQLSLTTTSLQDAKDVVKQIESDSKKEIGSLKVRLTMAEDEYKTLYCEIRRLEISKKKGSQSSAKEETLTVEEPVLEETVVSVQASQTLMAATDSTMGNLSSDSRYTTITMEELNDQLMSLTVELEKRKAAAAKYQKLYKDERIKRKEKENLYREMQETKRQKEEEMKKKYRDKQDEVAQWKDKFNKMHTDYLKTKHAYESLRYDRDLTRSPNSKHYLETKPKIRTDKPTRIVAQPPPLQSFNHYRREDCVQVMSPPGKYQIPDLPTETGVAIESDCPSCDVRIPPGTPMLPEPLKPQVTQQAKVVALKASLKDQGDGIAHSPTAPQWQGDEEQDLYQAGSSDEIDEDIYNSRAVLDGVSVPIPLQRAPSPTVFHDAPEYQESGQACPVCHITFPPGVTDEELAKHVQDHFSRKCGTCDALLSSTMTDQQYRLHVEEFHPEVKPPPTCPICGIDKAEMSDEDFEEHVNRHLD